MLTNGVSLYDSTGVANALTADILRPTQKLSLDARYGYDVDGHKLNSVLHERVERYASVWLWSTLLRDIWVSIGLLSSTVFFIPM